MVRTIYINEPGGKGPIRARNWTTHCVIDASSTRVDQLPVDADGEEVTGGVLVRRGEEGEIDVLVVGRQREVPAVPYSAR